MEAIKVARAVLLLRWVVVGASKQPCREVTQLAAEGQAAPHRSSWSSVLAVTSKSSLRTQLRNYSVASTQESLHYLLSFFYCIIQ